MHKAAFLVKSGSSNKIGDWEHIVRIDGFAIHRRKTKLCGECSFRADGLLADIDPDLLMRVYRDIDYQKTWDPTLKEVRQASRTNSSSYFCKICLPCTSESRDFIVTMSYKELNLQSKKFFVCEKEGVENTPDSSKKNEFKIFLAATSDDNNGSLVFVQYCFRCDRLPVWCTNWAIKFYLQRTMPNLLTSLQRACENYSDFLMKKENPFMSININYN